MDLFDSCALAALLGLGSFGFSSFLTDLDLALDTDFLATVFDRLLLVSFFCYFLTLLDVFTGDLEAERCSDFAGDDFFETGTSFTSSILSLPATFLVDCLPEVLAGVAFSGEGLIADFAADCFLADRFAGDGDFLDFAGEAFLVDFFAEAYLVDLAGDFLGDGFELTRCSSTCMSTSTSSSSAKSYAS